MVIKDYCSETFSINYILATPKISVAQWVQTTKPKTEELEFKYLHFINPYDFMRYFIGILNSFAHNPYVYRNKIRLQNDFGSIITSLGKKYAKTVSSLYNMTFKGLKFK